ncbi:Phage integrase family protein [Stieleria neptunia]|uniref:Phage integrase family protein n=1 Tax=Stieleria neptunia TaxID=2527979 RepID=A0A518HJC8_9BACT|nr:site-specific integrase [Stieleria neptunia]QDV40919.1 Phage integrase family protein [Stieleria neptunia]
MPGGTTETRGKPSHRLRRRRGWKTRNAKYAYRQAFELISGHSYSLDHNGPYVFRGPRRGRLKPDTVRNILVSEVITPLSDRFPKTFPGQKSFEDGRLHSLRHYVCSRCANERVPERMVIQWLGHSDSAMVRHYDHLSDDESCRKMDQLNLLGGDGGRSGVDAEQTL